LPLESEGLKEYAGCRKVAKETMKDPGKMFEMFRIDIKATCEKALEQFISMELTSYPAWQR